MELNECINFLLSASQNTVFQMFSEQLEPYEVTPAQYGVLKCLWDETNMSPKQIGEKLYLGASSVSSVLDRMQKNDLIDREIDPDNRRGILVSATQKGLDLQEPIEKIVDDLNKWVFETFSDDERAFLREALMRITRLRDI